MAEDRVSHNEDCSSPLHHKHLCYITSQGFHFTDKEEFEALTKDPQFKCQHCGRGAHSDQNLCEPAALSEGK